LRNNTIIICLFFFLTACFSSSSSDGEETFEYWYGAESPDDINVINGQYYQSPHFTLEYELFLEFKSSEKWWREFIEQNQLELDRQNDDWKGLADFPVWFAPKSNFLIYSRNDRFDRSRYFFNSETGLCFIYETVGM